MEIEHTPQVHAEAFVRMALRIAFRAFLFLAALVAVVLAARADAGPYPLTWRGGDSVTMQASEDASVPAEVVYCNSPNSITTRHPRSREGIEITAHVRVGARGNDERVTIEVHTPGLVAMPEVADVVDGECVTIQVRVPMF